MKTWEAVSTIFLAISAIYFFALHEYVGASYLILVAIYFLLYAWYREYVSGVERKHDLYTSELSMTGKEGGKKRVDIYKTKISKARLRGRGKL